LKTASKEYHNKGYAKIEHRRETDEEYVDDRGERLRKPNKHGGKPIQMNKRKKLKRPQQRPILSFDELIAATDIERKAYGQRRSTNARAAKKEKAAKDPAYALQLKVDKKKYHDTEYTKIKARRKTDEEYVKDRRERSNKNQQVWRKAKYDRRRLQAFPETTKAIIRGANHGPRY